MKHAAPPNWRIRREMVSADCVSDSCWKWVAYAGNRRHTFDTWRQAMDYANRAK